MLFPRREGDDAIATMSLKRRFIVSEKGRMINIICIIIFFILSHLSPSPGLRQGARQGGPSSGRPVTSGSAWRAEPRGWQVEGGQSSSIPSLRQATMERIAFSRKWLEPAPCLSQRKAMTPGSAWCKAPLWKANITKVSGHCWIKSKCDLTSQEWSHPAPVTHCWKD